jgi:hypothetical protein
VVSPLRNREGALGKGVVMWNVKRLLSGERQIASYASAREALDNADGEHGEAITNPQGVTITFTDLQELVAQQG